MFATLLLPALVAAQPQASTSLSPDTEARWVPFELSEGNQLRFTIQVNGRPATAILDSGVTDSFVTAAFAGRIGLKARSHEQATAIGGSVEIGWARGGTIAFGGLTRTASRIGISGADGLFPFGADMFVGADVLSCCALDIDHDNRRFRLLPSGRMPFTGTTLPLSRASTGLFRSEIAVAGRRVRPVVIDTGDGSSLTVSRANWVAAGYKGARLTTTLGWGMGGVSVADTAVVSSVSFGNLSVHESELRIEDPGGFLTVSGSAGRVGTGLLMRFRVLLDPGAGRMVLQPGKQIGAPVIRSTSGLLMHQDATQLRVVHVMRNSPAAHAGWRDGETICEVNGVAVADMTRLGGAINWGAGAPGTTVRLTLCDGTRRALTLRRFY
ncbi:aspartyl protease family protein [Sphingomonas xinjiangensis]|uniref:Putative aspartyl protease n=1 Tax=Sphingomonas xinjiangensis TaxID=643568 RepID=A0A840YPQ9_9SPHN|nr:aspartyl protease family protein [Sphingomonas xinjiangensis]MBB5710341.1 putative aspartyl protease [Sphingomonas xinjiangensis]